MGATGVPEHRPLLQHRDCHLGARTVTHQFLYVPECLVGLLGRDLLSKLQAQITFTDSGRVQATIGGIRVLNLTCPMEQEWRLYEPEQTASEATKQMCLHTAASVPAVKWEEFEIPEVWAEDNPPGLAHCQPPIHVELKLGA